MDRLEQLIISVKESLEHEFAEIRQEMRQGFADVKQQGADSNKRIDTHDVRLERQGGFIQAGSRWSTRMTRWSENVDAALAAKDREIADLRERIARL